MNVLICGSVAYDFILKFEDDFKNHLLKDDLENVNISFYAPKMNKSFGGCAGNIAYSVNQLGLNAYVVAAVGSDFAPYKARFLEYGIHTDLIKEHVDTFCAQAFVTNDLSGNQITTFHPGAMLLADNNEISKGDWSLALVGPDNPQAMVNHAKRLEQLGVDFIFDPGQALPVLSQEDCLSILNSHCHTLILNSYEANLLAEKLDIAMSDLPTKVDTLIVTQDEQGSVIYHQDKVIDIDVCPAKVVDTTGCGDAYRAGIMYGILHQLDWYTTGCIASVCAAYKLETKGTQNYTYSLDEFNARLVDVYQLELVKLN